ncbi:hypothetical protein [Nocardioides marmorisolisilvae]|uniref:Peptidase n=1 Tax=Nocardioides marmorisolisilvae TaxID=1542737 RepID=A0A3N0DX59_9ACTN|nr:hypothetical protein [Nocardioides marmorisolisilvae]RNL80189.1 hypothetical protein EFL95_14930 [Nocardioides marmorisolisilvae]
MGLLSTSYRFVVLVVLASAPMVGLSPATASGGSLLIDVPGDAHGFVHVSNTPVFSDLNLAPGLTTSGTVSVRDSSSFAADLTLRATDLRDLENGCLRPETNDGDVTCDPNGGELSKWLVLTVRTAAGAQLWQGTLASLGSSGAALGSIDPGETETLAMSLEFPRSAGNDTMSDSTAFELRFSAKSENGGTAVSAPASTVGSNGVTASPGHGGVLPASGNPITARMLGIDLLLLALGSSLVFAAKRSGTDRRRDA